MFKQSDFGELAKGFEKIIDDVMNRSIGDLIGSDFIQSIPPANVRDNALSFEIEVAAPGLEKSLFDIQLNKDQLEIRVNQNETSNEKKQFTRREFNYISFFRTFTIPEEADRSKISAVYEKGILIITLPKKDISAKDQAQKIHVS